MKKIFLALGLIFVFLVATNIQSIAQADKICACVNKNGKMRFTDSGKCKKKERLICWDAEGQQGPAGADGLNCWDLNEDGICNLPAEDIDGDGGCDVDDCQGVQGEPGNAGGIKVWDSSIPPQYLGYLIDVHSPEGNENYCAIFIPSLGAITYINVNLESESQTRLGDVKRIGGKVYFDEEDCSGTPFTKSSYIVPNTIYRAGRIDYNLRYFLVGFPPTVEEVACLSRFDAPAIGQCTNESFTEYDVFEATEIAVADIPFTLPVVLPLVYESEAP